jgi:putative ABC transport system permease protein
MWARARCSEPRLCIVRHDLVQSSLVVLAALLLSLATIVPLGKLLAAPWSLSLELPWSDPKFFVFLGATLVGVTVASGLYPALVLSRVRRAAALRLGPAGDALAWVRGGLVGLQFAAASGLAVAAIIFLMQRHELHDAVLGRLADQYVGFDVDSRQSDALAAELALGPGIKGTTSTSGTPFENQQRRVTRTREASSSAVTLDFIYTGHGYFAVMDVALLAGRAFERDRADDVQGQGRPRSRVLDRSAAQALGWPEPASALGEIVYAPGGVPHEIVGVVERVAASVRSNGASGTAYVFAPTMTSFRIVRIASDRVDAALAHIDATMKSLFPERPAPPHAFFDRYFEAAYSTFELMNRALTAIAAFALAISGIGLFGMATYMANRRTREIGIRKVQGATPASIMGLLLWDFSKPVVWANLVAWPLAMLAIARYLSLYAWRMEAPREIDDDAPVPAKLRFAIAHKLLLGLEYNARLRVVEPHDFGAMNGTSKVFVYQLLVDGAVPGDRTQGWRLLDVAKIGTCKVLEQTFAGSRAEANQEHLRWDAVFARVE